MLFDFQTILGLNLQEVWSGGISVRRALLLVGQLGDEPRSRYRAAVLGAEYMGWGRTESVLANIFDRITALVEGGDMPEDHLYPRPEVADAEVGTVAEFDVIGFERKLGQ